MDPDFVPVFFDLETTGGADWDEIIQIGAVTKRGRNTFNTFVVPSIDIPEIVTDLTGYEKYDDDLYYEGEILETVPLSEALQEFLEYLQDFNKPVILVAHGGFASDFRFIIKYYKECDLLDELSEVVQGFCDSLPLLKKYLPDMESYKLEYLVKELVWPNFEPHDALQDSKGLAAIFRHEKLGQRHVLEFSRSFDDEDRSEEKRIANKNLRTLNPLRPYVPFYFLKKMAWDDLDLDSLQDCLCDDGPDGLEEMLSETLDDGSPRITRKIRIINSIIYAVSETLQP